jgi:hypothetical protein
MSAVFVGVLVVCGGAALAALLSVTRKQCPNCRKRKLSQDIASQGGVRHFTCGHCESEWRSYNGGGLVSREAFDAGAREPIPTAIVRREGEP